MDNLQEIITGLDTVWVLLAAFLVFGYAIMFGKGNGFLGLSGWFMIGAVPVHGMNGIWGTISLELFGKATLGLPRAGLFYGGGLTQLGVQLLGVVVVAGLVFVTMGVIFRLIDRTVGLQVSADEEYRGLDIGEHGIQSYSGFQIID